MRKLQSKKTEDKSMYLVEGILKNKFYDKITTWLLNRELMNPINTPSKWQHAVVVVGEIVYHLDNEGMNFFEYPISSKEIRTVWLLYTNRESSHSKAKTSRRTEEKKVTF